MKTNKGFTLVEVMIVVAIIGLLAAIAIPNLLRARINANDGATKGDLRAFSTAAESYRAAQSTPAYPATVADLTATTAGPSYLDASWTSPVTKHGHTLTYAVSGNSYTVQAESQSGASQSEYCMDHTGVLKSTSVAASTVCSGGALS